MAAMTRTEDQRTIDRTLIASMLRRGRPRRQIVDHFMTRDITEGPRISYNILLVVSIKIDRVEGELDLSSKIARGIELLILCHVDPLQEHSVLLSIQKKNPPTS